MLPHVHDEDVALDMNDDLYWEEDDEGEEDNDISLEDSDGDMDDQFVVRSFVLSLTN